MGTQTNRLNETVLLSTQNMFKLMGKEKNAILSHKLSLSGYVNYGLTLLFLISLVRPIRGLTTIYNFRIGAGHGGACDRM